MCTLAIDGGTPYRTTPFPARTPFGDEEVELATQAIRSQNLFGLGGEMTARFEAEFAEAYGVSHAVGSTSGTAAIHVAVGTINPDPGDEIITGPITDGGSIVPIVYQNAIPIFADIDSNYCMDPADIEAKITERTRAIMVIHLAGNPCDMDRIMDIARRHNLPVIEDCSQAHMTHYKGRLLGTIGDIGCFSLQQSKHMTTGDGGMTITNRDDWSERMWMFRDKGWARKPGWGPRSYVFLAPNYRITELHSAVGLAQLRKVRAVCERRHELGSLITEKIAGAPGIDPAPQTEGGKHTYWMYPFRVKEGSALDFAKALSAEGVGCGAGYIGKPIFMCMEALAGKMTFGRSQHPFDGCHGGREIEYTDGMCPRTEWELEHMVTYAFNENFSNQDALDVAGAICKVAEGLERQR